MRALEKSPIASSRIPRGQIAKIGILFLLFFSVLDSGLAQVTSTIQGHISDPTGASVPKALVKVTNEKTGVSRSAFSAEDGYYRIPDLLAGTYQVRVELSGFKAIEQSGIEVSAQSTTNLNLTLELGEVTQTIDITGEETQVETSTSRISEVIGENELKALPTAGRGIYTLTMVTPGITGKSEGGVRVLFCCDVFSNYSAPRVSSGRNENKANYLLDGINLRYSEGSTWATAFSPNPDAVTEVRVSTNPTSPDLEPSVVRRSRSSPRAEPTRITGRGISRFNRMTLMPCHTGVCARMCRIAILGCLAGPLAVRLSKIDSFSSGPMKAFVNRRLALCSSYRDRKPSKITW